MDGVGGSKNEIILTLDPLLRTQRNRPPVIGRGDNYDY